VKRFLLPLALIAVAIIAWPPLGDASGPNTLPGKKFTFMIAVSKNASRVSTVPGTVTDTTCRGVTTRRHVGIVSTWTVASANDGQENNCDEAPFLNGTLTVKRSIIARQEPDFRGCFVGTWELRNAAGVLIARGTTCGTDNVGTHRHPLIEIDCEHCKQLGHFEGVMNGEIVARISHDGIPLRNSPICLSIALGQTETQVPTMTIEGSVWAPCRELQGG
jgi:hypothetical protein